MRVGRAVAAQGSDAIAAERVRARSEDPTPEPRVAVRAEDVVEVDRQRRSPHATDEQPGGQTVAGEQPRCDVVVARQDEVRLEPMDVDEVEVDEVAQER